MAIAELFGLGRKSHPSTSEVVDVSNWVRAQVNNEPDKFRVSLLAKKILILGTLELGSEEKPEARLYFPLGPRPNETGGPFVHNLGQFKCPLDPESDFDQMGLRLGNRYGKGGVVMLSCEGDAYRIGLTIKIALNSGSDYKAEDTTPLKVILQEVVDKVSTSLKGVEIQPCVSK